MAPPATKAPAAAPRRQSRCFSGDIEEHPEFNARTVAQIRRIGNFFTKPLLLIPQHAPMGAVFSACPSFL